MGEAENGMKNPTSEAPAPVTSRDFAKGLGTTLLARLGGVIDVLSQPLYVWLFGLPSFGLYAVLWATINLVENVADLGMTSSLQRVVPQAKDERAATAALRSAMVIGLIPCIAIALGASLFAPHVAPLFNVAARDAALLTGAIRLFAWALPLWAFLEIATSALRARRLFGAEIRIRIFWEQLIRMLLAVILWLFVPTIMALLIAHLVSLAGLLALRLLARHYQLRHLLRGPLIDPVFFETFRAGIAILPANAVARLFGDAPPIVLNAILPGAGGATAAALYTIARKVSSIVQLVRSAFAYVLAPLASSAARGGKAEVQPLYAFATRMAFAIVIPLGCVMAAGGDAILDLFGPGADDAHAALIVLVLARMTEALFGSAVPVQQVIGGYRAQVVASATGLAAAALVFAFLAEPDLIGMALAVSTGFIVAAMLPLLQLHRYSAIHPFEAPFLSVALRTVLIALPGLALALTTSGDHFPEVAELPAVLVIGAATIWASVRFALPRSDRAALGRTATRLRLL